jgi:hypothetical protein
MPWQFLESCIAPLVHAPNQPHHQLELSGTFDDNEQTVQRYKTGVLSPSNPKEHLSSQNNPHQYLTTLNMSLATYYYDPFHEPFFTVSDFNRLFESNRSRGSDRAVERSGDSNSVPAIMQPRYASPAPCLTRN